MKIYNAVVSILKITRNDDLLRVYCKFQLQRYDMDIPTFSFTQWQQKYVRAVEKIHILFEIKHYEEDVK